MRRYAGRLYYLCLYLFARLKGPQGKVTEITESAILGWALSRPAATEPPEVELRIGGRTVSRKIARRKVTLFSGDRQRRIGFRFPLSEIRDNVNVPSAGLSVVVSGKRLALPVSTHCLWRLARRDTSFETDWRALRSANTEGKLVDRVSQLVEERRMSDRPYVEALRYLPKLLRKSGSVQLERQVYNKAFEGLMIEEFSESMIKRSRRLSIPLLHAASFRASLTMRSRKKELGDYVPEWRVNPKLSAYRFANTLGVRSPWVSDQVMTCSEVPLHPNSVIKPVSEAGATGVYMVFAEDHILSLKTGELLKSRNELTRHMQANLESGRVRKDRWIMEELVRARDEDGIVPRDLKFYCFYGKCPLVLEIKRYPEKRFCFRNGHGNIIHTGKYEGRLFEGRGPDRAQRDFAARVSRHIPAPFVRLDFLDGADGLVLGEVTPRPGRYETFTKAVDQWLGDYFLDAEGRLLQDLLNGASFEVYHKCLSANDSSNTK